MTYEWTYQGHNYKRLLKYLLLTDKEMKPSISSRVVLADYADKISQKAETVFIVLDGEDIASCSVYCNTDIAFITNFSVKSSFSGKGVGSFLMDVVKNRSRESKCKKIRLEVFMANSRAIAFYEKNLFTSVGKKGDYLLYECELE